MCVRVFVCESACVSVYVSQIAGFYTANSPLARSPPTLFQQTRKTALK